MTVERILRTKNILVRKNCKVVICDYRVVPSARICCIDDIEKNGWALWQGLKKDIPTELLNRTYACACAIGKGIEKVAIITIV